MNPHNHLKRVITSILLLPLLIGIIYFGNGVPFALLIIVCICLCMREFFRMMLQKGVHCFDALGIFLGIIIASLFLIDQPRFLILAVTISVILVFMRTLISELPLAHAVPSLSATLLGILYCPLMMGFLIAIRQHPEGRWLIFLLLAIIWSGDTMAFYTGSLLGRRPLCPGISPKKTMEGMVGGMAGSTCAALILGRIWFKDVSMTSLFLMGVSVGTIGQISDLSESVLKRWAGVKESGAILPGHGGLLDRVDGLIFSAPVFYYYIILVLSRG